MCNGDRDSINCFVPETSSFENPFSLLGLLLIIKGASNKTLERPYREY